MSQPDRIFATARTVADFDFGAETAAVFDDMLSRSVPFYGEIQRMVAELTADYAQAGGAIYDLGCSTAEAFLRIAPLLPRDSPASCVGVDSSPEMLAIAARKLADASFPFPVELRTANLDCGVAIADASVVLLVLTLQFIRPLYRDRLLADIYDGLRPGGCLLLVEKVLGETPGFNRQFIKHYYELKKRNGYSDLEIAQKREALENVLVPYRVEENRDLLERHGFHDLDVFFKWYNFCGLMAVK
jgi:tRNA (cmo5U34)-methyltransferase